MIDRPSYKISIKNAGRILKRYKGFLSKKDLGKVLSLSLEQPHRSLVEVTEEFLEKKYSVDQIETLLNSAKQNYYTYEAIMKKLGLSRSRFYFRLNYIRRFVLGKKVKWALKKGKIVKLPHARSDKKHINRLLKHKNIERRVLLNPGPVLTSYAVKNALIQNDICHRDTDFELLMRQLQKNALKVFRTDDNYSVLFISGSGTAGMESVISSTIPRSKKLLVLANGSFGERFYEIAKLHNIKTVLIKKPWGELFDLKEIERELKKDKSIFAIALNHHETSVGVLNPIHEIGQLAKKHDKLFIVDAISSLGGEKLSMVEDNIDICVSSANKCLHGFSGVNLICVHDQVWDLIEKVKPRSFYLDLKRYYKYLEHNQTPFTPSVAVLFALNEALKELLKKGLRRRHLRYIEINSILKFELSRLGFEFFTNHDRQSHAILTVKVPQGIDFRQFYRELKREGFTIYPCKPPLEGEYFQIANMGELRSSMIYDFIFTLEKTLKKLKKC